MPEIVYWIGAAVAFILLINALFGEFGSTVQGVTTIVVAIFTIVSAFIVNFVIGMCAIVFFLLLISWAPHTKSRAKPRKPADDFSPIKVRPASSEVKPVPSLSCKKSNVKKLIA